MCFMVCYPLQGYLSYLGYDVELVEGEINLNDETLSNHYWLKLNDGTIIDPTASQFKTPKGERMPGIYIGEKPEWYIAISN